MSQTRPYKTGIALSGGGARGFAHAGALKALEEAGIKIDIIAGVSAGAVVSVLYSGGVRPDDMIHLFDNTGFTHLVDFRLGGGGLFNIDKFMRRVMRAIAPHKNLEDLKIPVYVCATDLNTAKTVTFDSGAISPRVCASCSIPIIFKPVEIDGNYYVDGGVLQNLPARVIRDKCETLIGINVSPISPYKTAGSLIDVAVRSYNLMAKANQQLDMDVCDMVVETHEISQYRVFNLKEIQQVFNAGYINMRSALRKAGWWGPDKEDTISINQSKTSPDENLGSEKDDTDIKTAEKVQSRSAER